MNGSRTLHIIHFFIHSHSPRQTLARPMEWHWLPAGKDRLVNEWSLMPVIRTVQSTVGSHSSSDASDLICGDRFQIQDFQPKRDLVNHRSFSKANKPARVSVMIIQAGDLLSFISFNHLGSNQGTVYPCSFSWGSVGWKQLTKWFPHN